MANCGTFWTREVGIWKRKKENNLLPNKNRWVEMRGESTEKVTGPVGNKRVNENDDCLEKTHIQSQPGKELFLSLIRELVSNMRVMKDSK